MQRNGDDLLVYILLYQADANNHDKWLLTIKSLIGQSISRPIYRNENDVAEVIRSKNDKKRSGFVAIYVNQADILSGRVVKDAAGHELVRVKENAIDLKKIVAFYQDEKKYSYREGKLVLEMK